ncbi:MAG TPA: hypothetical protein VF720_04795, partial [Candidatus Eisenbacteria bacterium]
GDHARGCYCGGMNLRGLLATLILSAVLLWLRAALPASAEGDTRFQRRGLLVLAVVLPVAGLLIPLVPWRVAAVAIVVSTVVAVVAVRHRLPGDG